MEKCQSKCQITRESLEAEMEKIMQETEKIQRKIEELTENQQPINLNSPTVLQDPAVKELLSNWLAILPKI